MERAVGRTSDVAPAGSHRFATPWGLITAIEVLALAFVSLFLVLSTIPGAYDVDWGCVSASGETRTSGDTYVAAFAVGGALGWLAVAGATVFSYASGKRWIALALPAVWFGVLVVLALAVASAIGPLPC